MSDTGYVKLKNKFVIPEYTPAELSYMFSPGKNFHSYQQDYNDVNKYALCVWGITEPEKIKQQLIGIIPERYRDRFHIQCSRIPHGTTPHIDPDRQCSINFYVSTQGCITKFFNVKETPTTNNKNKRQAEFVFRSNQITEIGSFVAEDGDVFLLNTGIPHQVVTTQPVTDRKMLCLFSRYSFADVAEMLAETGAI
jgi:hypothetical protein